MVKVEEVDNVLTIKCGNEINGRVLYWTTLYYYKNLVIDTGCPHTAHEIKDFFRNKTVEAILITHYHEDHCGGAYVFKQPVYAPRRSLEILRNPPKIPKYRQIVWGQPKSVHAKLLKNRMEFEDVTVEVIETPGHSFDHVSFLIDEKLFSGDLVMTSRQMVCMKEENYIATINSLKKILKLKFDKAYGGTLILTREKVEEYLNYLLELKERAEELYSEGKTIKEIVNILFPNVPRMVYLMETFSGLEWSRENFIKSLLASKQVKRH